MVRRLLLLTPATLTAAAVAIGVSSATGRAVTTTPASGPATGGTLVTFAGDDLSDVVAVRFGGAEATIVSRPPNPLQVTSPPGTGVVDVTLSRAGADGTTSSTSSAGTFSYVPAVTSLTPDRGSVSGDTQVTIAGAGFTGATHVRFGERDATDFTADSDTRITATSPPGGGAQDVTVTGPTGTSAATSAAKYARLLAVTRAAPGPGASQFTLDGIGFAVATAVHVDDSFTGFATLSDAKIVVAAPAPRSRGVIVVDTPYGSTAPVTYAAALAGVPAGIGSTTGGSRPDGGGRSGSDAGGASSAAAVAKLVQAARVRSTPGGLLLTARLRLAQPARLVVQVEDGRGHPLRISAGAHETALSSRIDVDHAGSVMLRIRVRDRVRAGDVRRITVAGVSGGRRWQIAAPVRR